MEGLESKEWTKICRSLNEARRIVLFNSDLLFPFLDEVVTVMVKAMKNPRSALCKTAIMATADFFNAYGNKLLQSDTFDSLVNSPYYAAETVWIEFGRTRIYLFRCWDRDRDPAVADASEILPGQEVADKAISALVGSTSPVKLIDKLRAVVSHPNLKVRAKAAGSISACVTSMDADRIEEFGKASLLQMTAELLNNKLPEVREAARGVAGCLYKCIAQENAESEEGEKWQSFCQGCSSSSLHGQDHDDY